MSRAAPPVCSGAVVSLSGVWGRVEGCLPPCEGPVRAQGFCWSSLCAAAGLQTINPGLIGCKKLCPPI